MTLPQYPALMKDSDRCQHTRKRRRMLSGTWDTDLRDVLRTMIDPTRLRSWGPEDTTKNNFRNIVHQLATLYDEVGATSHQDAEAGQAVDGLLKGAGWWQLGLRHQRYVIGLRESLVRIAVHADGSVQLRLVTADLVHAAAHPDTPDIPHTVEEWRPRMVPQASGEDRPAWTLDHVSIEDPERPVYRVFDEAGNDISSAFLGDVAGAYPAAWRKQDGTPFLPYVLAHAERTGKLWDPYEGSELVHGSLIIASLWTFWNHCVFDASWPQRNVANGMPAGSLQRDENDERLGYVPLDPASILAWVNKQPGVPIAFHQFAAGADPEALGRAIRDYSAHLAVDYGISPSDIERTHGNAQSGWAVQLSRDGVRRAQRRFRPEAERADAELAWKVAAMHNRIMGTALPEDGYKARYRTLGKSLEELRGELEVLRLEVEMGFASQVDAYMIRHEVGRDEAIAALRRISLDQQMVENPGGALTPRELAEMAQKIYLSVGNTLSADEARDILNRAGAGLGPTPALDTRSNRG